jgi:hypothetical protein
LLNWAGVAAGSFAAFFDGERSELPGVSLYTALRVSSSALNSLGRVMGQAAAISRIRAFLKIHETGAFTNPNVEVARFTRNGFHVCRGQYIDVQVAARLYQLR